MTLPTLLGILNVTADSFSDGGRYMDADVALVHARALRQQGADVVDVGAASSHPDSAVVEPGVEMERLGQILPLLKREGIPFSVDSFQSEVQRYALRAGAAYLNDIHGFADEGLYGELAASGARLIVMHAVQVQGNATREDIAPEETVPRILAFFDARVAALVAAGVAREHLILDPGLGFFLGKDPRCSIAALQAIPLLRERYGCAVLIGASRKSFLRNIAGVTLENSLGATLGAELYAAGRGAAYIRTHEPGPLKAALKVQEALCDQRCAGGPEADRDL